MKFVKLFLFALSLAASSFLNAQNSINWNTEIEVSDGALYGNNRPRIVLTANDIPLVVYTKPANKQIYVSRWNGSGFSTPLSVLPANVTAYMASWTGPDIAAKGDTVIIVFKAEPMEEGNVYALRSTNGGITFSDTIRVDDFDAGVAWMPALDIDEQGNPSVTFMAHDSIWEHPRYVVSHSTDTGLSFEPSMNITSGISEEACDCCPAEYLINENREVLLYRNNDNNVRDVFAVYSTDNGSNYNSFTQVNQLDWNVASCPSSGPHGLLRSSDLITVSMSRASGKTRVYVSSTPATTTLGSPLEFMMTPPTNNNGNQNFPRISGSQDTIVMTWQEAESSNSEIFCAFTTNGNVNDFLSSKTIANVITSGAQSNPDVVYKNSLVHLVFQDVATGSVIYKSGFIGTAGTEENTTLNVSLYPNPTEDAVILLFDGKTGFLSIHDSQGKQLKQQVVYSGSEISLADLASGIYFFDVQTTQGKTVVRVIKN